MATQTSYNSKIIYLNDKLKTQMKLLFDYPCTLVEAPMGYGKTTAVQEYLANTDAYVLWQKVYDSSITGFWSAFCRLFSAIDANRSRDLAQLGFPNDNVSLQEALKLIMDIPLPEKTVLVIDDYHLLSGTAVSSFIKFLVTNEIDGLHMVLTARFFEPVGIEELFLKGFLCHITKENFELRANDIMLYYRLCGITLKDTEADQLYSTTDGWISALYLLMLGYKENGSFMITDNIYKLIEHAVYTPFSQEIKDLLLCLCIFDSFTTKQAIHMLGTENAAELLAEITGKNAFVSYDLITDTYQIHSIFTHFLKGLFDKKSMDDKQNLYEKAGHWCTGTGEYLAAMHYLYEAGDFENLLRVVELDQTNSFGNAEKDMFIKYFEECPAEIKRRHPIALLVYAMGLMTVNEMELFNKVCQEIGLLIQDGDLDADGRNRMMGEFEVLLSFTKYNDIMRMSQHHQKACALLKEPTVFMDTKGSWTFGSPSVLYMFYRESGQLEKEVQEMEETMPYYYQLTNGHGTGAEYIMEAEWHFNRGDFENAEIAVHKALYLAGSALQPNIVICALFLQVRLAFMRGDYANILSLYEQMHKEVEQNKYYILIHTIDMCTGYVNACLRQNGKIPEWLAEGDFNSSRLFFPARAFSNIIYGRVLLIKGEHLKLLGISGEFMGIASVFPNLLGHIYTYIYMAAANERIFRREDALAALRCALDTAIPDQVYMPFVENCDYIKPLLEILYSQGIYREDIARILELYKPYKKAAEQMTREYFSEKAPVLAEREIEVARLAAEGFSNREIGERLFITQNTVKTILKRIFGKLDINSRALLRQYFDNQA